MVRHNRNTMSNNKQSSVEWLEIELEKLWIKKYLSPITIKPLLEQAKAMHKEEHKSTYIEGFTDGVPKFEQDDNETFGGNNDQQ